MGGEGWLGFPDLWSGQKSDGTDISPFGEFWWIPEGLLSQIHSPYLHDGATGILLDLLRNVEMLKRERVGFGKQREATAPIHP